MALLERMRASNLWRDGAIYNLHAIQQGLGEATVAMPLVKDFLIVGELGTPDAPL